MQIDQPTSLADRSPITAVRTLAAATLILVSLSPGLLAGDGDALKRDVVTNYAAITRAAYLDALATARILEQKVQEFLEHPSQKSMDEARTAWVAARVPYLQTEATRFYDGPVDAVEGMINAWPIDENYIDYTVDDPTAGIINMPDKFPRIDGDLLASLNEKDGEKNISTGFHAIEFLLWGQDLSETGPGQRPFADYEAGPHADPRVARRRDYLRAVAGLLTQHLAEVAAQWDPSHPDAYVGKFTAMPPDEALALILKGMGSLSGPELRGERLTVAYATKEQENEHSCFSDTTCQDFIYDQVGIQNVYLGRYRASSGEEIAGTGLRELLQHADSTLAGRLSRELQISLTALKGIPKPFDQAIQGRDTDPGRAAIKKAIDALGAQTETMVKAATALHLHLNL